MKLAQLMRHPTKDLGEGLGIERRAIGGDTPQCQVTRLQSAFEPTEKSSDVLVGGIVVSDVIEEALVTAIIDRGENAEGTVIEFIGSDVARKGFQRPVQKRTAHVPLRLFFPQPPPSFGG